jgi:hypothetical protein
MKDELVNLASKVFTPSTACNERPLIHGRANENVKTSPNKSTNQPEHC